VCGVSGEVRAALGKIRARKRRGPTLDTGVGLTRRWRRQPAGGVRRPALGAMEYHAASGHHPPPPDWKRVRSLRKRRRGSTTRRLSQIPKPSRFTSISSCQQVAAPRRPAYQSIEFVKSGLIMCWSATRRCWTISRWRDLSRDGNPMLPLMDSSHWRPSFGRRPRESCVLFVMAAPSCSTFDVVGGRSSSCAGESTIR
jgi:hypothetical protein